MDSKYQFYDDDIEDIEDIKFNFGSKYPKVETHFNKSPLISYDYINLEPNCHFSFLQDCIEYEDITRYFITLNQISKKTINKSIDESIKEDHFHFLNRIPKKLDSILKRTLNKSYFRAEEIPSLIQHSLYTNENASRKSGVKSPRIFFLVGPKAVLYVFCYDPYHEVFNSNK